LFGVAKPALLVISRRDCRLTPAPTTLRVTPPSGKLPFRGSVNTEDNDPMGDKSPKSVNKKANQKNSKIQSAAEIKKQAEIAKSAAGKKR
jgi:hypothetical protein